MIGKPYEMVGTPPAGSGTRILSVQEVAGIMASNPRARDAVNRINNFEGRPRLAEKIIHQEYRKNVIHIRNNQFQIDAQLRKAKGTF